jgi:hypothetical protein
VVLGTPDRDNRIGVHEDSAPAKWIKAGLSVAGLTSESRIVDMQGLTGTGLIWVVFSDLDHDTTQLARLQKQGADWTVTKVQDLSQVVPQRLLVKSASEGWTVGSSGAVLRSNGGDPSAESAVVSFNLDEIRKAGKITPTLHAIAVGDRILRQVWVADEANGVLWRLAQPSSAWRPWRMETGRLGRPYSLTRSISSPRKSGARCAYTRVILMSLWPRIFCSDRMLPPCMTN